MKDSEIINNKYNLFRRDRSNGKRGGGVLLAVNSHLKAREVNNFPVGDSEILLVEIYPSQGSKILFVTCYNPPSASVSNFNSQLDNILASAAQIYTKVCVLGDFNMPDVQWSDCPSSNSIEQSNFCDTINTYGLVQINAIPSTKHGNILDLVITNTPHLFSNIEECDTSFMSDHVVLSFSIYERFKYRRDTSRLMYSYKHTNVNGLIDDLTNSKLLPTVQLANSIDDTWSEWLHLVNDAIDKNVPKRIVKNNSGPAWVDSELRQLQKEKLKVHRKAKRTGGSEDWLNFRHVHNKVNSLCRSKHKLFIQNLGIEVNSNPKKFWSYVKSKTGSRVIPPDMIYNGVKLSSPDAQASGFNEYFH